MKLVPAWWSTVALALAIAPFGCAVQADRGDDTPEDDVEYEQPFTSDRATLMNFEFEGELLSSSNVNVKSQVRAQMLFSIGQLNGEDGVSRLDRLAVTHLGTTSSGGLYRIRYRAKLPVAWGSKTNLPSSYELVLPKRVDQTGQQAFLDKYGKTCNDGYDDSVNLANFWYHYRPKAWGCSVDAADVLRTTARATVSSENQVAKYPEYHKVWEDGRLDVVAIFGKYEDNATSNSDAGIAAWNEFLGAMKSAFPQAQTTPATLPSNPGVSVTDVTFHADLPDGRKLQLVALLVDNVRTAGAAFDKRYSELSPGADLILYNGHAGLGANVRALSQKGKFFPGKYQIFFMNGCDTFAYVDGSLAQVRAPLNPDDPSGSKYMDIVTNAMPAYFMHMSEASMALLKALGNPSAPKSYGTIFREIHSSQVVIVTGEEDNVFRSTTPLPAAPVFETTGAVVKDQAVSYQTDVLPAGKYVFAMTPDGAAPGGDADLYVRVGAAPTATATYKCKSYVYNSNERCAITLTAPARVHMIAKGDKTGASKYRVLGYKQ